MGHSYLQPLAALLLVAAAATVAATSGAVPVAAATANKYIGRMVIIGAPGARVVDVSAAGALINKWQQQQRRLVLVENQVAPEFGTLLGAGYDGYASNDALNKDRGICLPHGQCAAHGRGGSITRPCTFKDYCPHTPTAAGHARAAVHW